MSVWCVMNPWKAFVILMFLIYAVFSLADRIVDILGDRDD